MTPSVSLRPAASRAGERSAFIGYLTFYNKATPSVTFGDSSPTGGAKKVGVSLAFKNNFCKQNHAFAQQDPICAILGTYCLIRTKRCAGDKDC